MRLMPFLTRYRCHISTEQFLPMSWSSLPLPFPEARALTPWHQTLTRKTSLPSKSKQLKCSYSALTEIDPWASDRISSGPMLRLAHFSRTYPLHTHKLHKKKQQGTAFVPTYIYLTFIICICLLERSLARYAADGSLLPILYSQSSS